MADAPLLKVPRGLLDLLRIRTLGRNPDAVDFSIKPTIDATEHYGSDLVVVDSTSIGAGAITRTCAGTSTFPGRLIAMGGFVVVGAAAGTQIRMMLSVGTQANITGVPVGEVYITAPVIGATYTVSAVLSKPIVFGPGWQFILTVQGDAGGADHTILLRSLFENYAPA